MPSVEPNAETHLIAGPPAASPPLFIAVMLVALSIAGPFIFVQDGSPSLLLGITAVAVAVAGAMTLWAAVQAQLRWHADNKARQRATISLAGITLHPTADAADNRHFAWADIEDAQLMQAAFIVQAGKAAPHPGRHAIRFGKLATPRPDIIAALGPALASARPPAQGSEQKSIQEPS
jgi:hypothetical protein